MTLAELPGTTTVYVEGFGVATLEDIRGAEPEYITTEQAEERWSYRRETWAGWAKDGLIEGARFDRMWRLPPEACRAHVRRLTQPRRRAKATTPQAARSRSAAIPSR